MSRPPRRAQQPRGMIVAAAIAALLLVVGGVGLAATDNAGEPVRLEYRAGLGCPDRDAFVARVRARTARAQFVGEGEGARTFTVELAAGAHPAGSVTVRDGSRSEGARRLEADTCDGAADAIALMIALAVDPHALRARAPEADAAPALPAEAGINLDAAAEPPPDSALSDSSAPPSPAPPPAVNHATNAPDAAPARSPSRPLHFFGGVNLAAATSLTPSTLFAGAPYLGWRATGASLVGPSVRVAFLRAGSGVVPVTGGHADFTLTVGRIDACAMLWPNRPLRLGACARAEAGILDVSGDDVPARRTQPSPWVAAGMLARLEWTFFGPLLVDVEGGPAFHITAHSFSFLPDSPANSGYTVPVLGLFAETGVGVHFL